MTRIVEAADRSALARLLAGEIAAMLEAAISGHRPRRAGGCQAARPRWRSCPRSVAMRSTGRLLR